MTYLLCFFANLAYGLFLHFGLHQYHFALDLSNIQGFSILGVFLGGATALISWLIPAHSGFFGFLWRGLGIFTCIMGSFHSIALFLWIQTLYK